MLKCKKYDSSQWSKTDSVGLNSDGITGKLGFFFETLAKPILQLKEVLS